KNINPAAVHQFQTDTVLAIFSASDSTLDKFDLDIPHERADIENFIIQMVRIHAARNFNMYINRLILILIQHFLYFIAVDFFHSHDTPTFAFEKRYLNYLPFYICSSFTCTSSTVLAAPCLTTPTCSFIFQPFLIADVTKAFAA